MARAAERGGGYPNGALRAEVSRMRKRVANQESYERARRAYVLAGLSSHAQQRATTRLLRPLQVVVQPSAGSVGGGEASWLCARCPVVAEGHVCLTCLPYVRGQLRRLFDTIWAV